jgi:hypothetical protein
MCGPKPSRNTPLGSWHMAQVTLDSLEPDTEADLRLGSPSETPGLCLCHVSLNDNDKFWERQHGVMCEHHRVMFSQSEMVQPTTHLGGLVAYGCQRIVNPVGSCKTVYLCI